eukprot:TRINITY_DN2269_c0_g1_i2.p1 TRINITY_DN2269_c0_g1~~TRINITY_DN2269_c0_g1_i2.p1  ORF type:complete len:661 (-),score=159.42 TRINITY_DN2269_c0_g1_i2:802-2784(-)
MIVSGGGVLEYYDGPKVTHVVADNLSHSKERELKSRVQVMVVKPSWIVSSTKNGVREAVVDHLHPQFSQGTRIATTNTSEGNSQFIPHYFGSSRLHFIGTWKSRLMEFLSSKGIEVPSGSSIPRGSQKWVIHIDMDCFFAAVAERNHPEIRGKPVVIAHSVHTSEISTSNYVARKHGICHGMPVRKARELCSDLVVMPYEFEDYETVSFEVYETLFSFQRAVCPVSCDEAFLEVSEDDLTHSRSGKADVMSMLVDYAAQIRKAIFNRTHCTASAGIGPSMLLARIATQAAKPDGVCSYSFEDGAKHMSILPVRDLPGVGWAIGRKLKERDIETCADLRRISLSELQAWFGKKTGKKLFDFSRGIDDRPIPFERVASRKSVNVEVNWGVRFSEKEKFNRFLLKLCSELCDRLRSLMKRARRITLTIRTRQKGAPPPGKFMGCGICDEISKSRSFPMGIAALHDLASTIQTLYRDMNIPDVSEIRGIGLQASDLESSSSVSLAGSSDQKSTLDHLWSVSSAHPSDDAAMKKTHKKRARPLESDRISFPPLSQFDLGVWQHLPVDVKRKAMEHFEGDKNLPIDRMFTHGASVDEIETRSLHDLHLVHECADESRFRLFLEIIAQYMIDCPSFDRQAIMFSLERRLVKMGAGEIVEYLKECVFR